jgi:hypothetical protein
MGFVVMRFSSSNNYVSNVKRPDARNFTAQTRTKTRKNVGALPVGPQLPKYISSK